MPNARLRVALCARPRLPQGAAPRLARLAGQLARAAGSAGYRVFVDSAPVLEKALARNAGLGWIGKHTNLLDRDAGSWFFLGEIFTDLPLPVDAPASAHCGTCTRLHRRLPDARDRRAVRSSMRGAASRISRSSCDGAIPEELRAAIGNRIYGCDDCQLVCPWNSSRKLSARAGFPRAHGLDRAQSASSCSRWSEAEFLERTEGSAIRRIGYERWLRNIAVALGNAPPTPKSIAALERTHATTLRQHWCASTSTGRCAARRHGRA